MEIKAHLENYTDKQREDFIVTYNHQLNYEIKEYTTSEIKREIVENEANGEKELVEYEVITTHIEAWGYTEEEIAQQEKEKVAMLKLTRGDVFRGLLQAKGITRSYIRDMIEQLPAETTEEKFIKEMALIDFDEALDFYRGNQLINTIGLQLGITPEQLDEFFKTNDYKVLLNE